MASLGLFELSRIVSVSGIEIVSGFFSILEFDSLLEIISSLSPFCNKEKFSSEGPSKTILKASSVEISCSPHLSSEKFL